MARGRHGASTTDRGCVPTSGARRNQPQRPEPCRALLPSNPLRLVFDQPRSCHHALQNQPFGAGTIQFETQMNADKPIDPIHLCVLSRPFQRCARSLAQTPGGFHGKIGARQGQGQSRPVLSGSGNDRGAGRHGPDAPVYRAAFKEVFAGMTNGQPLPSFTRFVWASATWSRTISSPQPSLRAGIYGMFRRPPRPSCRGEGEPFIRARLNRCLVIGCLSISDDGC